jgi:hypothetical protein
MIMLVLPCLSAQAATSPKLFAALAFLHLAIWVFVRHDAGYTLHSKVGNHRREKDILRIPHRPRAASFVINTLLSTG